MFKMGQQQETHILKVDLDIRFMDVAIKILTERLKFLSDVNILPFKHVTKIELFKKSNYSAKIYLNKDLQPMSLILLQSILGDDWKRTAITFRDYKMNLRNYNRLFDVKRYVGGEYKTSKIFDVFDIIKKEIVKNKNE